jgi:hypothetical protein
MKVRDSMAVELVRKATRLRRCFWEILHSPEGRYDATGETKSARGPTKSRNPVFARDRRRTCVEVARSVAGTDVDVGDEDEGSDKTMVPMLEITISHYMLHKSV